MKPKTYPLRNELRVAVLPKDGTITNVQAYAHTVDWVESGPSTVTYCNVCGFAIRRQWTSPDGATSFSECAKCGAFMGWNGPVPDGWTGVE